MVDLSRSRFQMTTSIEGQNITINPLALRLDRIRSNIRQEDFSSGLGLNRFSSKHWESFSRTPDACGLISLGRMAILNGFGVNLPAIKDPNVRTAFATVYQNNEPTDVVFTLKLIRISDLEKFRAAYVETSKASPDKRKAGRPVANKEPSATKRDPESLQWIVDGSEYRRVADERKLSLQQLANIFLVNVTTLRRWVNYDRVGQNITLSALGLCMVHMGKYQGLYARDMITFAEYDHLKETVRKRFMEAAEADGRAVTVTKASLKGRQMKREKRLAGEENTELSKEEQEIANAVEGEMTIWTKKHVKLVMDALTEEYERDFGVPAVGVKSRGNDADTSTVPTSIIQRRLKSDPFIRMPDDEEPEDPAYHDPDYMAHLHRMRQEEEAEISRIRSMKSSAELWAERREKIEDNEAYFERQEFYQAEHDAEEDASKWAGNIMACLQKLKASENNGKLTEYLVQNLSAIDPSDLEGFLFEVMKNHLLAEAQAKMSGEPPIDDTNLARPETLEDLIAVAEKKKRPPISRAVVSHDGGLVGRIKRA